MARQLNIRSDDAYRVAHDLAKRLDTTTTDVVIRALKTLERATFRIPSPDELTPEQRADFETFDALSADLARHLGPEVRSDHDTLHDESGLPK